MRERERNVIFIFFFLPSETLPSTGSIDILMDGTLRSINVMEPKSRIFNARGLDHVWGKSFFQEEGYANSYGIIP
jgi:hypothetical protein